MKVSFLRSSLLISFYIFSSSVTSQTNELSEGLKAGDTLPDYLLTNVINYPSSTVRFSDFKGKLLILDFWSTHCTSCIASWPKLLELQKKYDSVVQILLINPTEDTSIVRAIFKKRKLNANVNVTLPVACGDRNLNKLFGISGVPHVVYVDKNGNIISVNQSVTVRNIEDALIGKNRMVQKLPGDNETAHESMVPLFMNGNGGQLSDVSHVVGSSLLIKGRERKLFSGKGIMSQPKFNLFFACVYGYDIVDLYKLAYSDDPKRLNEKVSISPILNNRFQLQVKDTSRYRMYVDDELQPDNIYYYQLLPGPTPLLRIQEMMRDDLKRYFGLNAKWVKQKRKCLVLLADDTTKISYKGGATLKKLDPFFVHINNISVKYLMWRLEQGTEYSKSPYPIVDETNLKGTLGELEFEAEVANYKSLNIGLKKYKMHFELLDRYIDVLVVSEPPGYRFPFGNYNQLK